MFTIQHATIADIPFCLQIDQEISQSELQLKISNRRYYLLNDQNISIGVMRYNLMYDTIPFLTLIYIVDEHHRKGYGTQAMKHWENEMRFLGFQYVMTSTQSNEQGQFFYRKLGYKDCGCLLLDLPEWSQPLEIFMIKSL